MFAFCRPGPVALAPGPSTPEENLGSRLLGGWGGGVKGKDQVLSSWRLRVWETEGRSWSHSLTWWGGREGSGERSTGEESKEFRMKASTHSAWLPGESAGSQAG